MNAQMSAEKKPRVCVAIVSYNSSATLPRCLDSLAAQTYGDFSVVLIDNASAEKPGELLSRLSVPTTYMEMHDNLGFAKAMNVALEAAGCEFLVALNPDAFPHPNWLAELVSAADQNSCFAAFGSVQISATDSTKIDGFGDNLMAWGQAWRGQSLPDDGAGSDVYESFGVCAAAALYRTKSLNQLGGFDDRFFCFYEDVDVSIRLRLAGHRCAVVRSAVVDHVGGASFEGKSDLADFLVARNQWWLLVKNMPVLLLIAILPGYILMQIYALIRHPTSSRMKGLREGLAQTGTALRLRRMVQAERKISALALNKWLTWNPFDFRSRTSNVKRL